MNQYNLPTNQVFPVPFHRQNNLPLDDSLSFTDVKDLYLTKNGNKWEGDLYARAYDNMLVVAGKGDQAMVYICKNSEPYGLKNTSEVNAANFGNYWITHNVVNTGEGNLKLPHPVISYTWEIDGVSYSGTTNTPNATYGNHIFLEKGTNVSLTNATWSWTPELGTITPDYSEGSLGEEHNPIAGKEYPEIPKTIDIQQNTNTSIWQGIYNGAHYIKEITEISVSFVDPFYFGAYENEIEDETIIEYLSKQVAGELPEKIELNCEGGKYMYLVIPTEIKFETYINGFMYNGWETTYDLYINYNGNNSAPYNIYRSEYIQNSNNIVIKIIK